MSFPEALNPVISTADIYTAVSDFISKFAVPTFPETNIFCAVQNRYTLPKDSNEYAILQILRQSRRGRNITNFDASKAQHNEDGLLTASELVEVEVQVDFYSSDDMARDRAQTIETLCSDGVACDFFKKYGIGCLYATDIQNLSSIGDSDQYVNRFMTVLHLSYWHNVRTELPWFSHADVHAVAYDIPDKFGNVKFGDIDVAFPASE